MGGTTGDGIGLDRGDPLGSNSIAVASRVTQALQSRLTAEFPTPSPLTSRLSRFADCVYKTRPVTSQELPKLDASLASACTRMGTVLAAGEGRGRQKHQGLPRSSDNKDIEHKTSFTTRMLTTSTFPQ